MYKIVAIVGLAVGAAAFGVYSYNGGWSCEDGSCPIAALFASGKPTANASYSGCCTAKPKPATATSCCCATPCATCAVDCAACCQQCATDCAGCCGDGCCNTLKVAANQAKPKPAASTSCCCATPCATCAVDCAACCQQCATDCAGCCGDGCCNTLTAAVGGPVAAVNTLASRK